MPEAVKIAIESISARSNSREEFLENAICAFMLDIAEHRQWDPEHEIIYDNRCIHGLYSHEICSACDYAFLRAVVEYEWQNK